MDKECQEHNGSDRLQQMSSRLGNTGEFITGKEKDLKTNVCNIN